MSDTDSMFTILQVLGQGTFSTVYKGMLKTGDNQVMTIKQINKNLYRDRDDWVNEVNILQRVSHKNLVKYQSHIETDTHVYILIKYIDGVDLHVRVNENTIFTEEKALYIFEQILDVFRYLHGNDVAHLDFKLENIMIDKDDNITVIDLGFAVNVQGPISFARGSPEYLSPDILSGKPYEPKEHDIWTIGVVLYAMVYGEYPFESDDPKVLYQKIRTIEPKYSDSVSDHVNTLIKGMLAKDPRSRLTIDKINLFKK